MNNALLIIIKVLVFTSSYYAVSYVALGIAKKKNSSASQWDVEIVAVSVIVAVVITSLVKHFIVRFV